MKKDGKSKNTCKTKKRIYVRQIVEKSKLLSEVDFNYDTLNDLLKKKLHERTPLSHKEELKLGLMLRRFNGFECYYDEAICKSDTCRFAGIPDEWAQYKNYDNLCELVDDCIKYGPNLAAPKCDAMNRRWPGDGFCKH